MCCDEGATSGDKPGAGTLQFVWGPFLAGVDVDAPSFTAGADYRVFAATMTGFSGGFAGTLRDIIALSDTTVLGAGDEEGAIGSASKIAGTVRPTAGTYSMKARQFKAASLPPTVRCYDFYLRVLSGSPIPEMEPEDGSPQAPRSSGWRGRVIGAATAKTGSFAITVNGEDTIGVIVAVDLERGVPEWNVIAGSGEFTGSFIMTL